MLKFKNVKIVKNNNNNLNRNNNVVKIEQFQRYKRKSKNIRF